MGSKYLMKFFKTIIHQFHGPLTAEDIKVPSKMFFSFFKCFT